LELFDPSMRSRRCVGSHSRAPITSWRVAMRFARGTRWVRSVKAATLTAPLGVLADRVAAAAAAAAAAATAGRLAAA